MELGTNVKGAAKNAASRGEDRRPTHDQLYLAERVNDIAPKGLITIPALQKLNSAYGVSAVSDALRMMRGYPPALRGSAFAYLRGMLKEQQS